MGSSFKMDTSKFKSLKDMDRRIDRQVAGVLKFWDGPVEAYMKTNAPWTDRTGNARGSLSAQYTKEGDFRHAIVLSGGVPYQIFLEVCNDGKYAIIKPTIPIYAPKVMGTLVKLLDRLGASA